VVEHVENRASQCDSITVIAQEQVTARTPAGDPPASAAPAPKTDAPPLDPPAISPTAPEKTQAPDGTEANGKTEAPVQVPQPRANASPLAQRSADFFRNRYDRIASLPSSSARRVKEGEYRVLIQISDEADRALAQSIEAALRDSGNTTPSIDLVPVRVNKAELRYFREAQAGDAQKLADRVEQALTAAGAPGEVTPVLVDRAGLPPGVMELWLP